MQFYRVVQWNHDLPLVDKNAYYDPITNIRLLRKYLNVLSVEFLTVC